MASLAPYSLDIWHLKFDIQKKFEIAEESRHREYVAARMIQKFVKGFLTRQHIQNLNWCATKIQTAWRGFAARRLRVVEKLIERVDEKWLIYYNKMAAKLQAVWRGHYTRVEVCKFYNQNKFLKDVQEKNATMVEQMQKFREQETEKLFKAELHKQRSREEEVIFSTHHLMRTVVRPGIFSNLETDELTELEKLWAGLKFSQYVRIKRKVDLSKKTMKPPIGKLFQGPFKSFEEVWIQRQKPLNPSVPWEGVLEKEVTREKTLRQTCTLHKQRFMRTYAIHRDDIKPCMFAGGPFKDKTQTMFRDDDPTKRMSHTNFTTALPYNKTFDDYYDMYN